MALNTATIIKGTVGVLGVSSLGVGGYYGIQSLNNQEKQNLIEKKQENVSSESVESKLKKEGLEKLTKTSNEWANILENYQKVSAKNNVLKFAGNNINNAEDLQERCEEILKKDVSEDNETNNYSPKANKWCIVPKTVSKALSKRKILNTKIEQDSEDQNTWDQKIKEYKAAGSSNNNRIESLSFEGQPEKNPQEKRKLIKQACAKLNEMKSYQDGYEEALKQSETWCTLPQ